MSHSFFSWKARHSFVMPIVYFLLGFMVAWLMSADTFRYMFNTMLGQ